MVLKDNIGIQSLDFLLDKWKISEVYDKNEDEAPPLCLFRNAVRLLELLHSHIIRDSRIIFHTDVDVDGIGTTFIIKRALENFGSNKHIAMINKEKVHGIQQKHVDYVNKTGCADLIIVTDSSSNDVDILKQFNCDVICIDHHEMEHNDTYGVCLDGIHKYVIVNNTLSTTSDEFEQTHNWLNNHCIRPDSLIENCQQYQADRAMSCGVVVYELLRLYGYAYDRLLTLESSLLVQWAGITLYTDVIDTINHRNQWYLDQTLGNPNVEYTLKILLTALTSYRGIAYKSMLDKNYIQYKLAPTINKAIRAGHGDEVLGIILSEPSRISEVQKYGELQANTVDKAMYTYETDEISGIKTKLDRKCNTRGIIEINASCLDIHPNYFGVIAGRLCDKYNHCAIVYSETNETDKQGNNITLFKGSFRGGIKTFDYRSVFLEYSDDTFDVKAKGHTTAFGFEATPEQAYKIMLRLTKMENDTLESKPFLTAGNMATNEMGIYHIDDIDAFKKKGGMFSIGTGNSRVITNDEIIIRIRISDAQLIDFKETDKYSIYKYKFDSLVCTSFSEIKSTYADIYLEMNNKLDAYIKEVR